MLEGDSEAFRSLLEHFHNYLMVVGLRYLNDKHRVQDVIHDVFVKLWNSKKDIQLQAGAKSYLRGAVVNSCLAIIRKDAKMEYVEDAGKDLIDFSASVEEALDAQLLQKKIQSIVDQLPEKCKAVFELSRVEGKSHAEISELLDISKKTIENHMTRALRSLREGLKEQELLFLIGLIIIGLGDYGVLCNTILNS